MDDLKSLDNWCNQLIKYFQIYFSFLFLFAFAILISACATTQDKSDITDTEAELSITVLYDNYAITEGTKADWGFSCLIKTADTTILFDTGRNGEILLQNSENLGVNLKAIDQIVISHIHPDHIGGLDAVLQKKPKVSVYFPISTPSSFNENIVNRNGVPIQVAEPVKLAEHVYLTGEMGEQIKEQSLILETREGLVLVTGCSHQGIANILQLAKEMFNREIILVIGGFHLQNYDNAGIEGIIKEFKTMGVQQCGASHCTGDTAMALFENVYGENFITMGVGKIIRYSN